MKVNIDMMLCNILTCSHYHGNHIATREEYSQGKEKQTCLVATVTVVVFEE